MLPRMTEGESIGSIYDRRDQPVPALKAPSKPSLRSPSSHPDSRPRQTQLAARSSFRPSAARRGERRPNRHKRHKVLLFWSLLTGLIAVVVLAVYLARHGSFTRAARMKLEDLHRPPPLGAPLLPTPSGQPLKIR